MGDAGSSIADFHVIMVLIICLEWNLNDCWLLDNYAYYVV